MTNKNIRIIDGIPLVAHSILQAKKSGLFEHIAVSSDSDEILTIASDWGADILVRRPLELATDSSAKIPAIRHCFLEAEKMSESTFETIVDLDATSPLRRTSDIKGAVQLLEEKNVSNVITGCLSKHSPYFNVVELDEKGGVKLAKRLENPVVRRQDAPQCFDMNASIYVWTRESLLRSETSVFFNDTLLFVMPQERSVDVDSPLDFKFVEFLMKENENICKNTDL